MIRMEHWTRETRHGGKPGTVNIWHSSHSKSKRRRVLYSFRHRLQTLASGGLHLAVLLETDGGDVDESSSLGRGEVTNLVHAGLAHVVELLGLGGAAENGHGALVGAAADLAVHGLLGSGDGGLEELTLGGEVHAVVQELEIVRSKLMEWLCVAYLGVVVGDEGVT